MGLKMLKKSLILALYCLSMLPIPALASVDGQPIMNHIQVIREFKQRHAKRRTSSRMHKKQTAQRTLTETYLAQPELKRHVEAYWTEELKEHKKLIDQILACEKEYASTHYVFYHGQQGNLRIIQDITKELFMLFNLPKHTCENFVFLRDWTKGSIQPDIASFFAHVEKKYGNTDNINDHNSEFRPFLLSVNPCLFGNSLYSGGECTFFYFMRNLSNAHVDRILMELVNAFCGDVWSYKISQYINKFTRGQLLQICIPKELVNTCVYPSKPFGIPRKYDSMTTSLNNFLNQKMGEYEMDEMQARILITPELLDPKNDIHIHRYQLSLTPKEEASYERDIKQLVHELVTYAYETGMLKVPAGCPTERLLQYINGTP
jgi:hypothetical protein